MSDKDKTINRNKIILTVFILLMVFAVVAGVLINSTFNDTICFRYVQNRNTGEDASVIESIFIYGFLWLVLGILLAGSISTFTMLLHLFLHRKDGWGNRPRGGDDYYYAMSLSLNLSVIVAFVFFLLHISNIITIDFFHGFA